MFTKTLVAASVACAVSSSVLAQTNADSYSLRFPLTGYDPSTVPVTAVVDHSPPLGTIAGRSRDGVVTAFDGTTTRVEWGCVGTVSDKHSPYYGEEAECNQQDYFRKNLFAAVGYPKEGGSLIDIAGLNYQSPSYLFYDGHFGTDFAVAAGAEIIATASGRLFKAIDDPVNGNGRTDTAWDGFHTFYIQHGQYVGPDGSQVFEPNGYSSWYLHSAGLAPDIEWALLAENFVNVERGQPIAYSGDWAYGNDGGVGDHLHFEVRKDGISKRNIVDPYAAILWEQNSEPQTIFADNFDDNSIDPVLWTYGGYVVTETNDELHVDRTVTDQGGWARSVLINIDPTKPILISRRTKVFAANRYFNGGMIVSAPGYSGSGFQVSYADYIYTGYNECVTYGFSIVRNGANPHVCQDQITDMSELIDPIWGEWFDEYITYDPVSGQLTYSINGALRIEYNVGPLPSGADSIQFHLHNWAWWTGHYHHVDDFLVRQ